MIEAKLLESLSQIPAAIWDALADPQAAHSARPLDPFTTHRFLSALESSHSVGANSGWLPRPLVLYQDGQALAAMPLYVKSHSQGEYIFDHAWADAFQRAGGDYYPKLQVAVPFTPVPGQRFLGPKPLWPVLADAAIAIGQDHGLSSLHITFCTEDEALALHGHNGLMRRSSQQFHWHNQGYRNFDAFLAALSARKRKMIRKERALAQSHGLTIQSLTGDQITPAHWQAFWHFYQDTGARKWGRPYLTRAAFDAFHATMRDDILLVLAFEGDKPVAGALNFIGREALFGRYWGTIGDYPSLHFELCYHRAVDYAIEHGLSRVEAGAQGEHKLARGYLPQICHSLHWINNPSFRKAVQDYLETEADAVDEDVEILTQYGPFKHKPPEEE